MPTTAETNAIELKTRELCKAILDHPDFRAIRERIDAFMANDEVKFQYQILSERSEYLQSKQQQGVKLSDDEVTDFEQQREAFFNNPVASGFLDAQREVHKMQDTVSQYVGKTFELGRLPTADDFSSGGCGDHSCGCHH